MIKSIYGLILLNESYKTYHFQLVTEYSLLFLLGYHIILLSFFDYNIVYCFETLIIVLIGIILKRLKNSIIIGTSIISIIGAFYLLSFHYEFTLFFVLLTFIVTLFFLSPLVFIVHKGIGIEIDIINSGCKNNPDSKVISCLK